MSQQKRCANAVGCFCTLLFCLLFGLIAFYLKPSHLDLGTDGDTTTNVNAAVDTNEPNFEKLEELATKSVASKSKFEITTLKSFVWTTLTTPAPTPKPTNPPTAQPTQPTMAPTQPTQMPTQKPTAKPTQKESEWPPPSKYATKEKKKNGPPPPLTIEPHSMQNPMSVLNEWQSSYENFAHFLVFKTNYVCIEARNSAGYYDPIKALYFSDNPRHPQILGLASDAIPLSNGDQSTFEASFDEYKVKNDLTDVKFSYYSHTINNRSVPTLLPPLHLANPSHNLLDQLEMFWAYYQIINFGEEHISDVMAIPQITTEDIPRIRALFGYSPILDTVYSPLDYQCRNPKYNWFCALMHSIGMLYDGSESNSTAYIKPIFGLDNTDDKSRTEFICFESIIMPNYAYFRSNKIHVPGLAAMQSQLVDTLGLRLRYVKERETMAHEIDWAKLEHINFLLYDRMDQTYDRYYTDGEFTAESQCSSMKANLHLRICQSRKWLDMDRVSEYIKNNFKHRSVIRVKSFTGMSIREQAQLFYNSHVILMPHGGQLGNAVFVRTNTVIREIRCLPHSFIDRKDSFEKRVTVDWQLIHPRCICDDEHTGDQYNSDTMSGGSVCGNPAINIDTNNKFIYHNFRLNESVLDTIPALDRFRV